MCYSWSKESRKTISSQQSYEKKHICEHNAKMSSFATIMFSLEQGKGGSVPYIRENLKVQKIS